MEIFFPRIIEVFYEIRGKKKGAGFEGLQARKIPIRKTDIVQLKLPTNFPKNAQKTRNECEYVCFSLLMLTFFKYHKNEKLSQVENALPSKSSTRQNLFKQKKKPLSQRRTLSKCLFSR